MADDPPPEWQLDQRRTYTPAGSDGDREYAIYVHESGDLRLRIAPASLDDEDVPGYTLQATAYPGFDMEETIYVRRVLTFERCRALAVRFMDLFAARYDGPATFDDALEYAFDRTKATGVTDASRGLGSAAIDDRREP